MQDEQANSREPCRGARARDSRPPNAGLLLLTRGAWLMLLEITVMRLAYDFDLGSPYPVFLLVLWVLGLCMVGLAALVWLPIPVLTTLSLAVVVLHNPLDGVTADRLGSAAPVWNLLHQPGAFPVGGTTVIAGYQLIPWIAVMALSFCAGPLFLMERPRRRRILVAIGAAAIVWFIAERAINGYGDPAPWATQPSPVFTVLSFLNTTKYPPSLDFLLMTLGPAFLLLAWLDRPGLKPSNPLIRVRTGAAVLLRGALLSGTPRRARPRGRSGSARRSLRRLPG